MQARGFFFLMLLLLALNGCGLISQGFHQNLTLRTNPEGAHVTFRGLDAEAPAAVSVRRRSLGYFVYRAEKEGFQPACQVINCATPRWLKVVDSIPLALPLLLDVALGTLANCTPEPSLTLEPLQPGAVPFTIQASDDQLIRDYAHGGNACQHPYLHDPAFAKAAERIVVTAGNLQQRYQVLGPLDFGRRGGDWVSAFTIGAASSGTAFSYTQVTRSFYQATPGEVNELVRRRALFLYGASVDAVINVAYQTNPRHDVNATGLAVRFVDDVPSGEGNVAARLSELKRLREEGLISDQEYQGRRREILGEL